MSVMPNPLSRPDASIGLACGLGHHSLRRPAHYPPRRPGHCAFLSRLSRPYRLAAWGRWNSTRETFPAEYGWRAIFGEGPKTIFPPSPLLQPAGARWAIAQSPPERPHGSRRAPFREPAVPTISSCEFVTI